MRTSSFSKNHPYAKTRGWVGPNRAANALPTVRDAAGNEVNNASEILVSGGNVSEPEDGVAQISFGGSSVGSNSGAGSPAAVPVRLFNSSGTPLIAGDVVVTDPAVDSAITTTSTASNTRIAGVVQEPIGVAEWGPVLMAGSGGYTSVINTTGTIARGNYALTSATAKLAGATAARVAGSFGVYLTGTDLPDFATASVTTTQDTSVTTFEVDMPAAIPAGRVLFLALWLESGTSAVSVSGWTLIGSESGFYYYYKFSEGDDTAEPTWTTSSVAVATVLLLHESVNLSVPIEAHDYDTSTSAATVSGLATAYAHYAIAGVQAAATPGSGFVRLGGGTGGAAAAGGTPALIQSAFADASSATFSSAVTNGNVMVAIPFKLNDTDTWEVDPRQGGTCPVDTNMAQFVRGVNTSTSPGPPTSVHALGIQGKVISDSYSGPFQTNSACDSSDGAFAILEFSNTNVVSYATLDDTGYDGPVDIGTFGSVGANDLVVMAILFSNSGEGDPLVNVGGFTQVVDYTFPGPAHVWVGYKVGNGACSVTLSNGGGQDWAAAAVKLAQTGASVSGTLAGKYIAHDASATSPFTGAGAQNDGVFAITLNRDARPSALLYGPDLGAGGSALAIGSNSTDVYPTSGLGAGTDYSPSTHHHRGVRQISHASNTFVGDITLTASGTLGITMPTAGTINLSAGTGGGGGGSTALPGWISAFIGTTDSTNYYWDGNDLAGFTEQTVSGSATWTEAQNLVSALVSNQTADDSSCKLVAQSFSTGDAWQLAVNTTMLGSDSGGSTAAYRAAGIVFTDGTGTTANCVIGHIQVDNGSGGGTHLMVGRHGTLTNINSGAPWVSTTQPNSVGNWVYIKLIYQAANTFRLQFGDGVSFSAFGESDISKTMTPTHVGLFAVMFNAGSGIATFGPLKKVA